jgi:16S rRNA (guanine1207-N2)-methyltransferase
MATPGTMTGELILDQLEEIHQSLAPGGTCVLACEADSGPILKQFRALFGKLSIHLDRPGLFCATATTRAPLAKPRDFSARFAASLPGGAPLELLSLPGVFCHRRPDAGGLALAEVTARDLRPGQRVLDMGCGCGLVGLLLATSQPETRVTFVDSHARALAATHRNLVALGLDGHTLHLSDTGVSETGFDLAAGNPPYYSDFRIAQLFIDTAYAALTRGGACHLVAKSTRELEALVAERFGHAEVTPRRGYGVVRAVR